MEYIFGTRGAKEVLKTKGSAHSDLNGFCEVSTEYSDQKITDRFYVVKHLNSAEDSEGNCYDWYEIDKHYRTFDKHGKEIRQIFDTMLELKNALCELDMEANNDD